MASILPVNGKWRAHIRRRSHNICKTFASEELARKWADAEEARIENLLANDDQDVVTGSSTYRVAGVYMLLKRCKIVYIGRSVHIHRRLSDHDRKGTEWDSFKIWPCSDWIRAAKLEGKLIAKHQPPLNTAMKACATSKSEKRKLATFTRHMTTKRKGDDNWQEQNCGS